MDGKRFRELVSGRTRGFSARVFRCFLACLAGPYGLIVRCRNFLYDCGLLKTNRFSVPVISVGNITLGGTGKSPMIAWLGRFCLQKGLKPGIISRGYGRIRPTSKSDATESGENRDDSKATSRVADSTHPANSQGVNDEFLELAFLLPDVAHLQNPDRGAAAREFLDRTESERPDILLLDDAMQHRRIARDLNIVLLDATEPFGFEHVFPRGTLREPLSGLRRADAVLLSRADLVTQEQRQTIRQRVARLAPDAAWAEVAHVAKQLVSTNRTTLPLFDLKDRKILAFCGIGNPIAFQKSLEQHGANIVELLVFPDHYQYNPADYARLEQKARELGVDRLLCTMKDLVKLDGWTLPEFLSLNALEIQLHFLEGEAEFRKKLADIVSLLKIA